jgi:hypothetical protein
MKKLSIVPFLLLIVSCDGYLGVMGTVTENGAPLRSATVKVVSKKGDLVLQTKTDSAGQFNAGRHASPFKGTYRVIFEKKGYKSDTATVKKGRGNSIVMCDQELERKN